MTHQSAVTLPRIFADAVGESHFGESVQQLRLTDFAPPAPAALVSTPAAARQSLFLELPAGWHGDFHPAPSRQLMVLLAGMLVVTSSDGDTQTYVKGDAVLVEDTVGRGHATRAIEESTLIVAQY